MRFCIANYAMSFIFLHMFFMLRRLKLVPFESDPFNFLSACGKARSDQNVVNRDYEEIGQSGNLLEYAEREIFQRAQGRLGCLFVSVSSNH